jgi:hypothetical protein
MHRVPGRHRAAVGKDRVHLRLAADRAGADSGRQGLDAPLERVQFVARSKIAMIGLVMCASRSPASTAARRAGGGRWSPRPAGREGLRLTTGTRPHGAPGVAPAGGERLAPLARGALSAGRGECCVPSSITRRGRHRLGHPPTRGPPGPPGTRSRAGVYLSGASPSRPRGSGRGRSASVRCGEAIGRPRAPRGHRPPGRAGARRERWLRPAKVGS